MSARERSVLQLSEVQSAQARAEASAWAWEERDEEAWRRSDLVDSWLRVALMCRYDHLLLLVEGIVCEGKESLEFPGGRPSHIISST